MPRLIHAPGSYADTSRFFPGNEPDIARRLPGGRPEIARHVRRLARRIDFGIAACNPADIRVVGGRHCGVIAAGNPPENRRTQNPSLAKGLGSPMLKSGCSAICGCGFDERKPTAIRRVSWLNPQWSNGHKFS